MRHVLVAILVTLVVAFASYFVQSRQHADQHLADQRALFDAAERIVEKDIARARLILRTLAESSALLDGPLNFRAMAAEARLAAELVDGWILLTADEPGQPQIFNTRLDNPLTNAIEAMRRPVRPEMLRAIERARRSGQPELSDGFIGRVAGVPVFTLSLPVRDAVGQRYVLTYANTLDGLAEQLQALALPEGSILVLADAAQRLLLRLPLLSNTSNVMLQVPPGPWRGLDTQEVTTATWSAPPDPPVPGVSGDYRAMFRVVPAVAPWGMALLVPHEPFLHDHILGWPLAVTLGTALVMSILLTLLLWLDQSRQQAAARQARVEELGAALDRARVAEAANARLNTVVAHELRSPLLSAVMAVEKGGEAGDLRIAASALRSALRITDDFMDLKRLELGNITLTPQPTDLSRLLRDTVEGHRAAARAKGLELVVNMPPKTLWCEVDAGRLRQILSNLIGNAIRYTDQGYVHVDLAVSDHVSRLGYVQARMSVTDTGIGVPLGDQAAIFQPFHRLEGAQARAVRGVGLGLSVTRSLVAAMEGQIKLHSTPGQGSRFVVTVPLKRSSPDSRRVTAKQHLSEMDMLIVEDSALQGRMLRAALAPSLRHVTLVTRPEKARAFIERHSTEILLCDLNLGDVDGRDLARHLLALRPDMLAIGMSAAPPAADDRAPFVDVLVKSADPAEFAAQITGLVQARIGPQGA